MLRVLSIVFARPRLEKLVVGEALECDLVRGGIVPRQVGALVHSAAQVDHALTLGRVGVAALRLTVGMKITGQRHATTVTTPFCLHSATKPDCAYRAISGDGNVPSHLHLLPLPRAYRHQ